MFFYLFVVDRIVTAFRNNLCCFEVYFCYEFASAQARASCGRRNGGASEPDQWHYCFWRRAYRKAYVIMVYGVSAINYQFTDFHATIDHSGAQGNHGFLIHRSNTGSQFTEPVRNQPTASS